MLNMFESGPMVSRNCCCAGDIFHGRRGIAGDRGARRYSVKGCMRRITARRKEDLAIAVRAKCRNCIWGKYNHDVVRASSPRWEENDNLFLSGC